MRPLPHSTSSPPPTLNPPTASRLDLQEDAELFSLGRIRSAGALDAVLGGDDEAGVSADVVLSVSVAQRRTSPRPFA